MNRQGLLRVISWMTDSRSFFQESHVAVNVKEEDAEGFFGQSRTHSDVINHE